MVFRLYLVSLLAVASIVHAAYDPSGCYDNSYWTEKDRQFNEPVTYTNLSICQQQAINSYYAEEQYAVEPVTAFTTNEIYMATKVQVKELGIVVDEFWVDPLNSDFKAPYGVCDGATNCMRSCQALCCIADGCETASVWSKKDDDVDIFGCGQTTWEFYCYLHTTTSSWTQSERWADCYTQPGTGANGRPECVDIVAESGLRWTTDQYNYYASLKDQNTDCPGSSRKLLAAPEKVPNNNNNNKNNIQTPPRLPSTVAAVQYALNKPTTRAEILAKKQDFHTKYGILDDSAFVNAIEIATKRVEAIVRAKDTSGL